MEEQIPLIIQISCKDYDEKREPYYYVVNYLNEAAFERQGLPKAWEQEVSYTIIGGRKRIKCRELKFYEGKNHIATLRVDLEAEGNDRLIEVEVQQARLVSTNTKSIKNSQDNYEVYYDGRTVCLSNKALQDEQEKIVAGEEWPLIKAIYEFVTKFIYPANGFPQVNKKLDKLYVEQILTDYVVLNPVYILGNPNFLGVPKQPIVIPDDIWTVHKKRLKKLTSRGCISRRGQNFLHNDLDLALKIVVNPQLVRCYQALDNCNWSDEKIIALNNVCTTLPREQASVDLTGMNFLSVFHFAGTKLLFEPGKLIEQSKIPIVFDYAEFDGLNFSAENDEEGCNWAGVSLRHASFLGSHLTKINFTKADLTSANFRGADLTGADLTGANIDDADFHGANLQNITWPLVPCFDNKFGLPKLDWDKYGADFILQQLEKLGQKLESEVSIEGKQAWANKLFDQAFSNIRTSEELIKFAALIDGKEGKFAYLRQETAFFRGSFWGCHGNTDTWSHIIRKLKVHLDILLAKEIYQGADQQAQDIHTPPRKNWGNKEQLEAFQKIMAEHRGRWFGEVTHTKLYNNYSHENEYYTDLPRFNKDMKKLRDSYIDQDKEFKAEINKPKNR